MGWVKTTVSSIALIAALSGHDAVAQTATDGDDFELDLVTITTRRTLEDLQDVPGSVTVLSEERLERSNINNTDDVILNTPGVSFTENASPIDLNVSIRGITDLVGASGTGPTNGIFLDGFLLNPTGGAASINPELVDLEQVEVAFGPQGTAFGRGTLGGAINFRTKKPTDEVEYSLELEAGSFADGRGVAIANLPIFEDGLLSTRFVVFGEISDGFIDFASLTDNDSIGSDNAGGRFSLRSQPTDRLTFDFGISFDRTNQDDSFSATQESVAAGDPINEANVAEGLNLDRLVTTANIVYESDIGAFKSNTGFLDTDVFSDESDTDGTAIDFLSSTAAFNEQSISQEFRFESDEFALPEGFGKVSFNIGTSFSFSEDGLESVILPGTDTLPTFAGGLPLATQAGLLVGAGLLEASVFGLMPADLAAEVAGALATPPEFLGTSDTISSTSVNNFGVFGDIRFRPIDKLELAVGARFHRDSVTVESTTALSGVFAIPTLGFTASDFESTEVFTAVTPNASIKYDWTDDFSTYVAFSTGYRPGGVFASSVSIDAFDEERVRSIEGGFKSTWFDNRLLVNASGYFIDYEDIQVAIVEAVSTPTGTLAVTTVDNAASARSVGSEITIAALPFDGLRLDAGIGVNFATFTDFTDSPFGDLTGTRLPNAPVNTFSLTADYEHPEPVYKDLKAFVRAEYNFRTDFSNLLDPSLITFDGFDVANFRAGLRGESMSITAFVENAFNEVYATGSTSLLAAGFVGADVNVDVGATRRFGVVGSIKF
ncbi:MAG: TonB-dependent receptor [Pseudomonadota bacterium]